MGKSALSYRWADRTWALPVDSACMVSAATSGSIAAEVAPRTWQEVRALARELGPNRVVLPANATHLYGTVMSLCHQLSGTTELLPDGRPGWWPDEGVSEELLAGAVDFARELLSVCTGESLVTDPIRCLESLASADDPLEYSPLVFQYVTYALQGKRERLVRFRDAPSFDGGPAGTLTGGVGLAVSSRSAHAAESVSFLRFASSNATQRLILTVFGGQAAGRAAWLDPDVNDAASHFYTETLQTMARSFLRPRFKGYPQFQAEAAQAIHSGISNGVASRGIAAAVSDLWRALVQPHIK